MKYSQRCIDLVKKWEGYHRELSNGHCAAYDDVGSADGEPITIGWGTTRYRTAGRNKYNRTKVMRGDTLTKEQAESELIAELDNVAAEIYDINKTLTQNQFDACVSFFFNVGFPLQQVKRLQENNLQEFSSKMLEYTKGGDGKVLLGLVNRRQDEFEMFGEMAQQMQKVTWWAFHRNDDKTTSIVGYDGGTPIERHDTNKIEDLKKIIDATIAKTFVVSDKPAPIIPLQPDLKPIDPSVAVVTRYLDAVKMPYPWRSAGLKPLRLQIADQEFLVVSGQGWAQNFRKPNDVASVPGCMEPIPQGEYVVGDIEWAGGKDNYNASWGPGLGPVWIPLTAKFPDDRNAFGIHIDYNMTNNPGSAGCLVLDSIDAMKALVACLRKHDPKTLLVDWRL